MKPKECLRAKPPVRGFTPSPNTSGYGYTNTVTPIDVHHGNGAFNDVDGDEING
ncbi:MAG TPA: hypothetical protein V6C78_26750 [Crinalium sp.]